MCTSLISAYCRCSLVDLRFSAVSYLTDDTYGHINITGHICPVHGTMAYSGADIQFQSYFTQLYSRKGTHCIRRGVGPARFGDEISCTYGDQTTIRNSQSPYPRHQTTPSWLDTV